MNPVENKKRIVINVLGRVQRVGFRIYTISQGETLDLTGYVKNEEDGSVTIVAEGKEEKLKELAEWAKEGPRSAWVKKMKFRWENYLGEFKNFDIKY